MMLKWLLQKKIPLKILYVLILILFYFFSFTFESFSANICTSAVIYFYVLVYVHIRQKIQRPRKNTHNDDFTADTVTSLLHCNLSTRSQSHKNYLCRRKSACCWQNYSFQSGHTIIKMKSSEEKEYVALICEEVKKETVYC
jgi:hypothetical protein